MLNGVNNMILPLLRYVNSEFYSKEEYINKIKEKRIENIEEELEGIISGDQAFERIKPPFQIWTRMKNVFKEMGPLTYERYSEVELSLENLKANIIPMGKDRKLVTKYHNIAFPPQQQQSSQQKPRSSSKQAPLLAQQFTQVP